MRASAKSTKHKYKLPFHCNDCLIFLSMNNCLVVVLTRLNPAYSLHTFPPIPTFILFYDYIQSDLLFWGVKRLLLFSKLLVIFIYSKLFRTLSNTSVEIPMSAFHISATILSTPPAFLFCMKDCFLYFRFIDISNIDFFIFFNIFPYL